MRENTRGGLVLICTSRQASIKSYENPISTSALIKEAKDTLKKIAMVNRITITWILVQLGYKGNDTADKPA